MPITVQHGNQVPLAGLSQQAGRLRGQYQAGVQAAQAARAQQQIDFQRIDADRRFNLSVGSARQSADQFQQQMQLEQQKIGRQMQIEQQRVRQSGAGDSVRRRFEQDKFIRDNATPEQNALLLQLEKDYRAALANPTNRGLEQQANSEYQKKRAEVVAGITKQRSTEGQIRVDPRTGATIISDRDGNVSRYIESDVNEGSVLKLKQSMESYVSTKMKMYQDMFKSMASKVGPEGLTADNIKMFTDSVESLMGIPALKQRAQAAGHNDLSTWGLFMFEAEGIYSKNITSQEEELSRRSGVDKGKARQAREEELNRLRQEVERLRVLTQSEQNNVRISGSRAGGVIGTEQASTTLQQRRIEEAKNEIYKNETYNIEQGSRQSQGIYPDFLDTSFRQ